MARKLHELVEAKRALNAKAKGVYDDLKTMNAKLEAGEDLTPGEQERVKNLKTAVERIEADSRAIDLETTEALQASGTGLESGDGNVSVWDAGTGLAGAGMVSGVGSFYAAIQKAGYDRRSSPQVEVPFNAATFDGNYEDAQQVRKESAGLGADRRYLYPSLVQQGVARDTTGVQSFRQKARTPAAPTNMIRDIDAVTNKPETGTETELVNEPLKQIATVESGIPNIMLESSAFRQFIEFDLRFAFSEAIDYHVAAQIAAATPAAGAEGENILEAVVNAAEEVASNGYNARILAAAPQDLIALLLLREPGTDDYVGAAMDRALSGLTKVAVKGLMFPMVLDPVALGTLYASPVDFRSFEENAGKTNTSLVRIEANGLYVVQRSDAAATANWPEISA